MPREKHPVIGINTTLTQKIATDLGIGIVTGRFKNGFPTEAQLCETYGTARTVTREAVKMLTAKGLLIARPRTGTRITSESEWNLLDQEVLSWLFQRDFSYGLLVEFTEVRKAIEPDAAFLCTKNLKQNDAEKIQAAFRDMHTLKDPQEVLEADIAFHLAILAGSGNRFYTQMRDMVQTALSYSIKITNSVSGFSPDIEAHERVCQAILSSDAEAARAHMYELIDDALKLILIGQQQALLKQTGT